MPLSQIKVGILDDHQVILEGLKSFLGNSNCKVIISTSNPDELVKKLEESNIDMVIVDIVIPNYSGIQFFKLLRDSFPDLKIIAYSSLFNIMLIENLLKIGVKAYVNKNDAIEQVVNAIKEVRNNNIFLPENISHLKTKYAPEKQILSEREEEILTLIYQQLSSAEIAEKLFISENTVEKHRKQLFIKLNVKNVAGLVKEGIQQGYLKV